MNHLYDNPHTSPVDRLAEVVERALRDEIKTIVEIESNKAAAEVQRQVRDKVGSIATRVCNRVFIERHTNELIVRVDFSQGEPKSPFTTNTP
jgi:thiamine monophosphate synthase